MDLYCQAEAAVLLASYAMQAAYGDADDEIELHLEKLLPVSVINHYELTSEMWEERIRSWWAKNNGQSAYKVEILYNQTFYLVKKLKWNIYGSHKTWKCTAFSTIRSIIKRTQICFSAYQLKASGYMKHTTECLHDPFFRGVKLRISTLRINR
jgi:hypothetical protein